MSTLQVRNIQADAGSNNTISVASGHVLHAPGHVLQVVNFVTSDQGSVSVTTADTTLSPDIAITVTPKASGSHFLIQARWGGEASYNGGWNHLWNLHRDGSRVNAPGTSNYQGLAQHNQPYGSSADDASTPNFLQFSTLDTTGSTAGTDITYRLVIASNTTTLTLWTNRCFSSAGETGFETFSSELIVTEIAQ